MKFNYYYSEQADQYAFYRIPKILITSKKFCKLSCEAKLLYGLMLDRMRFSIVNNWIDGNNCLFIIFTIDEIKEYMNCSNDKAIKLVKSLADFGLIEKKRRGQGKANIIYLKTLMEEI